MMFFWEVFGLLAGAMTTTSFIPQVIKGYRTKSLDDLSYGLNSFLGIGMFMWLIYGLAIGSIAVIAANLAGVAFNLLLIAMKRHYSGKKR